MQTKKTFFLKTGMVALGIAGLAHVLAATIFLPSSQPVGYVGQPAVSSNNIATGTAKMYTIDYNSNYWSGNLHSQTLSVDGTVSATDDWVGGAAAQIDAQSNPTNTRYITTMKNGAGIAFRWNQLSSGVGSQQVALDPATAAAAASSPILDYIRGSSVGEGTTYRTRVSRLGDIIHSTPVYLDDGVNKTVFVGANDGMLHAINALNGRERFAYIPSMLIPKLSELSSAGYSHKYFVDGRFSVKKYAAPTSRTILVGALGAGGKGLFGLDVSNAAATSEADAASKILWEITNTSTGYADLGDTYSAPILITLPNGNPAMVVGNGYNNTGSNGHAWLYLINPTNGALIHAFDTGSGTAASPNGLSSPSVWDTDGDGKIDTAYAGDIDGNLWKFDLVSYTTSVTSGITSLYSNSAGASQAITMAPALTTFVDIAHPDLHGVMVNFVTGRMLTSADATNATIHYAFGIWDGAPTANNTLLSQTLTESNYTGVTPAIRVRTGTANTPDWTDAVGHHKGWKTALPIGGERVVGDGAFITGGVFQFFSTNPTISPTATPPGENWWIQLNAMTGGSTGTTHFDLNGDGLFDSNDQVNGLDPVARAMGGGVRSQLIGLSANGFDVYQGNFDKNTAPPPPEPTVTTTSSVTTGDRGISDGHFDFDVYCATNCGDGVNASPGSVQRGSNNTTSTSGLNWSHMHEYDDIYDKTGVDLLAPSQDLHRLSRVKYGTAPTTSITVLPASTNGSIPTTGVTLVSTNTSGTSTSYNNPSASATFSYATGTITDLTLFPNKVVSGSNVVTTTKSSYLTTLTRVDYINVTYSARTGIYSYNQQTTVRTWTSTKTSVVTSPNFSFKVLLSNQAYSPAVHLSMDGASGAAYAYQAAAGLTMASLPTYQLGTIQQLKLEMPLDAFKSKDWGTGETRAGLMPTTYDCVVANPRDGPIGERRNGAITVQIVDASVIDSDVQLSVVANPKLGYRLKDTKLASKLIAEYTIFWHHPNGKCLGDSGWIKTPPQDASSTAAQGVAAPGSSDPFAGHFGIGDPSPVPTAGTVVTTVTNPNGSVTTTTVVTTVTALGGSTVTTTIVTVPPPSTNAVVTGIISGASCIGFNCKQETRDSAILGRITWREIQK